MNRLKSRQRHIPNGFKFYQPETNWTASRWASFDTIVMDLIAHRRGNPALVEKYHWSLDPRQVELEVEAYNVKLCEAHGWTDFITVDAGPIPPPKSTAPRRSPGRSAIAVAGGH